MNETFTAPKGNFRGHDQRDVWNQTPDAELGEVGPRTACGEHMRRFWMPVAMTEMRMRPSSFSSKVEPKMMLASGSTSSRMRFAASSAS